MLCTRATSRPWSETCWRPKAPRQKRRPQGRLFALVHHRSHPTPQGRLATSLCTTDQTFRSITITKRLRLGDECIKQSGDVLYARVDLIGQTLSELRQVTTDDV